MTILQGPNFSGRTALLRTWVGLPEIAGTDGELTDNAYIGSDAAEALSGLAPTVEAEFELSARDPDALDGVRNALGDLGFGYLLTQNPFTLSGGEQVVAAILAAAAGRPKRLAIDGALEQLAPDTRAALLEWLGGQDGELKIADNRLDEWWNGRAEILPASPEAPTLRPESYQVIRPASPEVEVTGLVFSYPKGRRVFDGLNVHLEAGRAYHLRGANGAGKTTLSKILAGLLKPQAGEIRFNGKRVKPWQRPGSLVSYHFQNPTYQLFSRTVDDQLRYGRSPEITAMAFGLDRVLSEHPLDLPFVLRKRVALANAADRAPAFLILDEPTLGQDRDTCDSLAKMLAPRGGFRISHSTCGAPRDAISL